MTGRLLIGGQWVAGAHSESLKDKFDGAVYGAMALASPEQVTAAVAGAVQAQQQSTLTPYQRFKILSGAARIVE
ncbi:MAG TPA: aldehyde dehydrogenase, partial [Ramlibacter sp.]|nr:aldehyde dehydrogenase [Ramlibacter sp.]